MFRGHTVGVTFQTPPGVQVGAGDVTGSEEERGMLLTAAALSAACAMELRAVLATAADSARDSYMQETLSEMQQSSSVMRTFGAMLVPRLTSGELDRDMAEAMIVQGGHINTLVGKLKSKLQPEQTNRVSAA